MRRRWLVRMRRSRRRGRRRRCRSCSKTWRRAATLPRSGRFDLPRSWLVQGAAIKCRSTSLWPTIERGARPGWRFRLCGRSRLLSTLRRCGWMASWTACESARRDGRRTGATSSFPHLPRWKSCLRRFLRLLASRTARLSCCTRSMRWRRLGERKRPLSLQRHLPWRWKNSSACWTKHIASASKWMRSGGCRCVATASRG
mmetsp:Transcript_6935/g.17935  ORF Transcript_6935/g.17935 Transcript_6935/m.17935 type:complete len:200 (-) Transcript_6935:1892-2491(-)